MVMSVLNYNHLRYFWVVAREGHLTRAAERLNLSQSALSSQVRKLEDQLGHKLFERRGRGLVLTEAGQVALDHADAIFSTGEELLSTLTNTGSHQRLRVGTLATLSRNFQIRLLRPILGDPDVEIVIRSGSLAELLAALEAHRLDVLLVNQVPLRDAGTTWTAHLIDEQQVSLVGTPERVVGQQTVAHILRTHPLIIPSADSGVRSGFDALTERLSIRPKIAAEVDDMAMMRVLAREDIGVAVLPPIVVVDELANGRLVDAAPLTGITECFSAITLKRRFPSPLLARLLGA
jgi:LysR family transcriptional regulator, transcriptional activator of nhaA